MVQRATVCTSRMGMNASFCVRVLSAGVCVCVRVCAHLHVERHPRLTPPPPTSPNSFSPHVPWLGVVGGMVL